MERGPWSSWSCRRMRSSSDNDAGVSVGIFKSFAENSTTSAIRDTVSLTGFVSDRLASDLFRLSAGRNVDSDRVIWSLHEFGELILRMAAQDWQQWRYETVPRFRDTLEFESLIGWINSISDLQLSQSLRSPHEPSQAALQFYLDIAAVMGEHFVDSVSQVAAGLTFGKPVYRAKDSRAAPRISWYFPSSAPLIASKLIMQLSGTEISHSDLTWLHSLLSEWQLASASSTALLLHDQLVSEVCPDLPDVLERVLAVDSAHPIGIAVGVTLIDLCRNRLELPELRRCVDQLALARAEPIPIGVAPSDFADFTVTFEGGFERDVRSRDRFAVLYGVLRQLLDNGVTLVQSKDGNVPRFASGDSALAFGRVVGLIIRESGSLRDLYLTEDFALMLLPKYRRRWAGQSDVLWLLPRGSDYFSMDSISAVHTAMQGVVEALGPGGTLLFTEEDWLDHF